MVAGLAGISEGYLSMIENGKRAIPSQRGLIVRLAAALDVSPTYISGLGGVDVADPVIERAVDAVRAALQCANLDAAGGEVQPTEQLTVRAHTALAAAQACRWAELGVMLPALIRDLHTSIDAGRNVADLLRLGALLYPQAVEAYLFGVAASPDLCWQAAQAGLSAARRVDEPAALGIATFGVSNGLLAWGSFDLAVRALDHAGDTGDDTLNGMLALTRCLLAASQGQMSDVEAPLQYAAELAERTGDNNDYWLSFGPSNVAVWRAFVALESEDYGQVAELAGRINLAALPTRRQVTAWLGRPGRTPGWAAVPRRSPRYATRSASTRKRFTVSRRTGG